MIKPDLESSADIPLFRALLHTSPTVNVAVDGIAVIAAAHQTVSSLLLCLHGPQGYRLSPVTGLPRAPLCMMGVCFECLVEVDGQSNQQGCLIRVRDGMQIRRQMPEVRR